MKIAPLVREVSDNGAVIPALTRTLGGKHHTFHPVGLEFDPSTTFEEWRALGIALRGAYRAMRWAIADWLVWGSGKFSEMADQVFSDMGYDYQTLANWKWVASRVAVSRRRENLSFGHHQEVARLEPKEQEKWLGAAEEHGWTRDELRGALAATGSGNNLGSLTINSLQLRIEDEIVIVAIERKGVWRDVISVDLEKLRRKGTILQGGEILNAFGHPTTEKYVRNDLLTSTKTIQSGS